MLLNIFIYSYANQTQIWFGETINTLFSLKISPTPHILHDFLTLHKYLLNKPKFESKIYCLIYSANIFINLIGGTTELFRHGFKKTLVLV